MKSRYRKYYRVFKELRYFSLHGAFKFFLLKLRGKSIIVTGKCHGCGTCCRSICLEGSTGWLRSDKAFENVIKRYPEYKRFEIIGKDSQGFLLFNCTWCTSQGTCIDYENRLPLCCNFPETTLVFSGGRLPVNCGYGFTEVVPFEKILKQEQERKK